jgi:hypothetical protein
MVANRINLHTPISPKSWPKQLRNSFKNAWLPGRPKTHADLLISTFIRNKCEKFRAARSLIAKYFTTSCERVHRNEDFGRISCGI